MTTTLIVLTQQEIIEAIQEYAVNNCNMQPPIAGTLHIVENNSGGIEISAVIREANPCTQ